MSESTSEPVVTARSKRNADNRPAALPQDWRRLPGWAGKCFAVVIAAIVVVVVLSGVTARVDAAEACAVTRFGKLHAEAKPGLHVKIPIADKYHCFRTAATFYEVLDDNVQSDADFTDGVLDGVTRDGQPVSLTFSVRFHIPSENVSKVYERIGPTMAQVKEKVVKFHSRSLARQVVQRYSAAEIYSGDLGQVSRDIGTELALRLDESWVVLEYFEIKRPRFDPKYEAAIQAKQIAREEIETKANQAKAAEQEAARAANLAKGEADAERIRAQGEADAIALRGTAVRDSPEVIALNYIEALKTINWAILDGANVTPFLNVTPPAGGSRPRQTLPP